MSTLAVDGGSLLVPGGKRDLDALKQEVRRRAGSGIPPLGGIDAGDAQEALSRIASLNRDEWAAAFCGVADRYVAQAEALSGGDRAAAAKLYWRAWRLYHFARWPTENALEKRRARDRAWQAFRRYAGLIDPPLETVRIPFEGSEIVAYLRLPESIRPAPLVFAIAGLDSRKEDIAAYSGDYLAQGVGLFAVDLPGTGESPHPIAETGSDRLFSAALDALTRRPDVDASRIVVQGRSWSGYWAAKLALVERARLRGAVMHGGPIHFYFQPEWLEASLQTGEYLYDYLEAKCSMLGAGGLDDLLAKARPFSLLEQSLLDRPSAPMLLVNGARDSQIPIRDLHLLLEHGDVKDAWINPEGGHMGRSPAWPGPAIARKVLMPWMAARLR